MDNKKKRQFASQIFWPLPTKTSPRHMNNEIMGEKSTLYPSSSLQLQNCGRTSLQPFCIYVGCSLLAKYLSEVWIWEHPKAYDCSSHRIDQLEEVNILPLFSKKGQRIIRSFNFWDISFRNISRKIRNIFRKNSKLFRRKQKLVPPKMVKWYSYLCFEKR